MGVDRKRLDTLIWYLPFTSPVLAQHLADRKRTVKLQTSNVHWTLFSEWMSFKESDSWTQQLVSSGHFKFETFHLIQIIWKFQIEAIENEWKHISKMKIRFLYFVSLNARLSSSDCELLESTCPATWLPCVFGAKACRLFMSYRLHFTVTHRFEPA